ncbi:MAG: alanine racemase [Deltaproteobacteria bacterium]|nr:alanine racemase [Deltaproteobacteria bacterium]
MDETQFKHGNEEIALRPTAAVIDLDAARSNTMAVRRKVGEGVKIMAVVKANAYGHGLVPMAKAFLDYGVDELGVAFLEEGILLRKAGIRAPILVLGGIIGNQIVHFLDYDLQLTASSVFKLQQIDDVAAQTGRRASVHLKIDTGMERIGVHWYSASSLFETALRAKHCVIRGVFSHLASSDSSDPSFTETQLARFSEALDFFPRHGLPMPVRHIANSAAILQHPTSIFEMVRPGLILYGVCPSMRLAHALALRPALSLRTRIVYFKVVRAGASVSYDRTWTADRDTRVVTLPVGYGDGYPRGISEKAQVLIHGKRYPVVGRITMDATMVNLGEDSAHNGDEVVLLGAQGDDCISVEELADWLGTIPYEILTMINTRVPRSYVPLPAETRDQRPEIESLNGG